eukprot:Gb_38793 [translate_table: standard]
MAANVGYFGRVNVVILVGLLLSVSSHSTIASEEAQGGISFVKGIETQTLRTLSRKPNVLVVATFALYGAVAIFWAAFAYFLVKRWRNVRKRHERSSEGWFLQGSGGNFRAGSTLADADNRGEYNVISRRRIRTQNHWIPTEQSVYSL